VTFVLVIILLYGAVLVIGTIVGEYLQAGMEYLFIMPFLYLFQALPAPVAVILEYIVTGLVGFLVLTLPYLLPYFFIISVLEDIGYVNRVNILFYEISSKTGYPCLAATPYVLGLGCSISALHTLKFAPDKRFQLLTAPLIMMAPCSAKSVIVIGLVLRYAGILPALLILLIDVTIIVLALFLMTKFKRIKEVEVAVKPQPLRTPTLSKTWSWTKWHMREFTRVGLPLMLLGSVVVGLLRYSGLLLSAGTALDPVAELLFGLSGMALLFLFIGAFRKEMGIQLFAIVAGLSLASVMSSTDMFVFGLMSTLFVPCLGAVVMLFRLFGGKKAVLMLAGNVGLVAVIGVLTHLIISIAGV
jgi:ferrous iron transport protein B